MVGIIAVGGGNRFPENIHLRTLEKDKSKILALYEEGYANGEKVKNFL